MPQIYSPSDFHANALKNFLVDPLPTNPTGVIGSTPPQGRFYLDQRAAANTWAAIVTTPALQVGLPRLAYYSSAGGNSGQSGSPDPLATLWDVQQIGTWTTNTFQTKSLATGNFWLGVGNVPTATLVSTYSISNWAVPTGDLSVNNYRLTQVATPTVGSDAVNKNYVDTIALGRALPLGQIFVGNASNQAAPVDKLTVALNEWGPATADVRLDAAGIRHLLRGVLDPQDTYDSANKGYVDALRQGTQVKDAVAYTSVEPLPPYTYAVGTVGPPTVGSTLTASQPGMLSIDGSGTGVLPALTAGARVLIRGEPRMPDVIITTGAAGNVAAGTYYYTVLPFWQPGGVGPITLGHAKVAVSYTVSTASQVVLELSSASIWMPGAPGSTPLVSGWFVYRSTLATTPPATLAAKILYSSSVASTVPENRIITDNLAVWPNTGTQVVPIPTAAVGASLNGIYLVQVLGDVSTPWKLLRSTDADTGQVGSVPGDLQAGASVFTSYGTYAKGSTFILSTSNPIYLDQTEQVWSLMYSVGDYQAGAGLSKDGSRFNVETQAPLGITAGGPNGLVSLLPNNASGVLAQLTSAASPAWLSATVSQSVLRLAPGGFLEFNTLLSSDLWYPSNTPGEMGMLSVKQGSSAGFGATLTAGVIVTPGSPARFLTQRLGVLTFTQIVQSDIAPVLPPAVTQMPILSVLGNPAGDIPAPPTPISATLDRQVLIRSSGALLGFRTLQYADLPALADYSVLGTATVGAVSPAAITASIVGQLLLRRAAGLTWDLLTPSDIPTGLTSPKLQLAALALVGNPNPTAGPAADLVPASDVALGVPIAFNSPVGGATRSLGFKRMIFFGRITGTSGATARTFTFTHNLNSRDLLVQVRDESTQDRIELDVNFPSDNTVQLSFSDPPGPTSFYTVIVVGVGSMQFGTAGLAQYYGTPASAVF